MTAEQVVRFLDQMRRSTVQVSPRKPDEPVDECVGRLYWNYQTRARQAAGYRPDEFFFIMRASSANPYALFGKHQF